MATFELSNQINHEIFNEVGMNLDRVNNRKLQKTLTDQAIKEQFITEQEMETYLKHKHDGDYARFKLKQKLQAKRQAKQK